MQSFNNFSLNDQSSRGFKPTDWFSMNSEEFKSASDAAQMLSMDEKIFAKENIMPEVQSFMLKNNSMLSLPESWVLKSHLSMTPPSWYSVETTSNSVTGDNNKVMLTKAQDTLKNNQNANAGTQKCKNTSTSDCKVTHNQLTDNKWKKRLSIGEFIALKSETLGSLGKDNSYKNERPTFGLKIKTPPSDRKPVPLLRINNNDSGQSSILEKSADDSHRSIYKVYENKSNNLSTSNKSKSLSDPVLNRNNSSKHNKGVPYDNWLSMKMCDDLGENLDDVFSDHTCSLSNSSKCSSNSNENLINVYSNTTSDTLEMSSGFLMHTDQPNVKFNNINDENDFEKCSKFIQSKNNFLISEDYFHNRQLSTITEASRETDKSMFSRHFSVDGANKFRGIPRGSFKNHHHANDNNNCNKYGIENKNGQNCSHGSLSFENNTTHKFDNLKSELDKNRIKKIECTSLLVSSYANLPNGIKPTKINESLKAKEHVHKLNSETKFHDFDVTKCSPKSSNKFDRIKSNMGSSNLLEERNNNIKVNSIESINHISQKHISQNEKCDKITRLSDWVSPKLFDRHSINLLELDNSENYNDEMFVVESEKQARNNEYVDDWLKSSIEKNVKKLTEPNELKSSLPGPKLSQITTLVDKNNLTNDSDKLYKRIQVLNIDSVNSSMQTKYMEIETKKNVFPNELTKSINASKTQKSLKDFSGQNITSKFKNGSQKKFHIRHQTSSHSIKLDPEDYVIKKLQQHEYSKLASAKTNHKKSQNIESDTDSTPTLENPQCFNRNNNNSNKTHHNSQSESEKLDKTLVNSDGTDNCYSSTPIKSTRTFKRLSSPVSSIAPADDAALERFSSIGSLNTYTNDENLPSEWGINKLNINEGGNAGDDDHVRRRSLSTSHIDKYHLLKQRNYNKNTLPPSQLLQTATELRFDGVCCSFLSSTSYLHLFNPSDRWVKVQLQVTSIKYTSISNLASNSSIKYKECDNPFHVREKIVLEKNSSEAVKVTFLPRREGIFIGRLALLVSCVLDDNQLAKQQHICNLNTCIDEHHTSEIACKIKRDVLKTDLNKYNKSTNNNKFAMNDLQKFPIIVCLQAIAEKPEIEISSISSIQQPLQPPTLPTSSPSNEVIDFGVVPLRTTIVQRVYISNKCRAVVPVRLVLKSDSRSINCFKFLTTTLLNNNNTNFKTNIINTNNNNKQILNILLPPSSSLVSVVHVDNQHHTIPVDIEFTAPLIDTKQLEKYECKLEAELNTVNPQAVAMVTKQLVAVCALAKLHIEKKQLILTFDESTHHHVVRLQNVGLIPLNMNACMDGQMFFVEPESFCIQPGEIFQLNVTSLVHMEIMTSVNNYINKNNNINNNKNYNNNNRIESRVLLSVKPNGPFYELKVIAFKNNNINNNNYNNNIIKNNDNNMNNNIKDNCGFRYSRIPVTEHYKNNTTTTLHPTHSTPAQQQQLPFNHNNKNNISSKEKFLVDGAIWTVKPSKILLVTSLVNGERMHSKRFQILNYSDEILKYSIEWSEPLLNVIPNAQGVVDARSSCVLTVGLSKLFISNEDPPKISLPWYGHVKIFCADELKIIRVEVVDVVTTALMAATLADDCKNDTKVKDNTIIPVYLVSISLSSPSSSSIDFQSSSENTYRLSVIVEHVNQSIDVRLHLAGLTLFNVDWSLYHISPIIVADEKIKEIKEYSEPVFKNIQSKGIIESNSYNTITFMMQAPSCHLFMQRWQLKVETNNYFQIIIMDLSLEVKGWMKNKRKSLLMSEVSICNMKPMQTANNHQNVNTNIDCYDCPENDENRNIIANQRNSRMGMNNTIKSTINNGAKIFFCNQNQIQICPSILIFQINELDKTMVNKVEIQNRSSTVVEFTVVRKPSIPFYFDHSKFKVESRKYVKIPIKFMTKEYGEFKSELILETKNGNEYAIEMNAICCEKQCS